MTPEVKQDMIRLAIRRAMKAVGSVNQLMEDNEEVAELGLAVLVELAQCLADHLVHTTIAEDGTPTTPKLAKLNVLMMLASALELGASREVILQSLKGRIQK